MTEPLHGVYARLRAILQVHAKDLRVAQDDASRYSLEATIGPVTLKSWRGKANAPAIPVAWVETKKAHVSYHLMGMAGNSELLTSLSERLRSRLHGKACFNFEAVDDALLHELERVTAESLRGMRKTGFMGDPPAAS